MISKNLLIILLLVLIVFAALLLLVFRFLFSGFRGENAGGKDVVLGGKIFRVEVASSTIDKIVGLSGRDNLGKDKGMLFVYDKTGNYGFWMKGMKFPLDIIWISGGKVAGFAENARPEPGKPPWSLKIYYPPEPVDKILEVNAGTVESLGVKAGDEVRTED